MSSEPSPALDPRTSNFEKYQTKNPLMQKVIQRFLDRVSDHIRQLQPERLVDLGCGEGMVAKSLDDLPFDIEYHGIELNPDAVAAAQALNPHRHFEQGNIIEYPAKEGWADVAICLEVLEHLDDPAPAVAQIARWTRSAAIISVPWEPFFRTGNLLRGKYLDHLGNHPEHVQQFTPRSLKRLLKREFAVVEIDTCFPWLIALCAKPTH